MHRFVQMAGIALWWLTWPGMWLILNNTVRTRLVLQNERGEMLVIRNWLTSNTKWSMPGGGLHKGEALLDGLLRETHEEIGLQIDRQAVRELGAVTISGKGIRTHLHYFIATVAHVPDLHLQRLEVSEVCWIHPNSLTPKNSRPDVIAALQLLDQKRSSTIGSSI